MATTVTHTNASEHSKLFGYLAAIVIAAVAVIAVWQVTDGDSTSTSSTSVGEPIPVDSSGLGEALSVTYDLPVVARSADPTGLGAALAVDPYRRAGNDPMGLGAVFGVEIPADE